MNRESSRIRILLALGLVLALAAGLRFWGLGYGIPHPTARPDEERLVGRAQTIFATSDWHPGSFYYGSLPFYVDTLALHGYYLAKKLAGDYEKRFDFLFEIAVTRPGLHYRICRAVSALAGIATVLAAFALSLAAYGRPGPALLAALALAVCPVHVRDSHFATVDVLMTLFVTLSLLFAVRAARSPGPANFVLAGLMAGLAVSSKYNAGLVVLAIAAAALLRFREARSRIPLAALGFALAFALTSPYVILRAGGLWSDMGLLQDFLYRSSTEERALWNHLATTLPYGLGWPLFVAAVLGLVRSLFLRRTSDIVLLAFAIPFLVLISTVRLTFPRYVLPLVPVFLVVASDFAFSVLERISRAGARTVAAAGVSMFLVVPSLSLSVAFDRIAARDDTRLEAAEYVSRRFQPRTRLHVCRGYGAPHLNEDRRRPPAFVVEELDCFYETTPPRDALFLVTHELDELSSFSRLHPSLASWLEAHGEPLATFSPYRSGSDVETVFFPADAFYIPYAGLEAFERGGPVVRIWKLEAP